MIIASTIAAVVFSFQPVSAAPTATLVRCGHLIAVAGQEPKHNVTVVIRGGKVEEIKPGFTFSEPGAKEVDCKEMWVLPGLVDCHVHMTMYFDANIRARNITESSELVALRGAKWAKVTVEAGFTTVRDLGANPSTIFALRDAVNQGVVIGPRILAAGHAITATGGHGDMTQGYRPGLFPEQTPADGVADGADECAKAVRNQIKLGADCIKLTATGGVLSASSAGLAQHFTADELSSIVNTAHSMGRKVAAHAHGVDGINAAVKAGVDSIEHGTFLDDESIRLMKQHGCYHVPTLLAGATVSANAEKPGFYLAMVAAKARAAGPKMAEMFKKSHAAGVKIAFGTDTGVSEHGLNAKEFKLMVDGGMTATEAIVAATVTASELLGLEKEVGTVEVGKAADLIATIKDPRQDVTELERVQVVVKGGERVK